MLNPAEPQKTGAGFLQAVPAFIPAEALALYLFMSAIAGTPKFRVDVTLSVITALLSAALVGCGYMTIPASERSRRQLILALLFSLVSVAIYLFALPDSFIHTWSPYGHQTAAMVLLIGSVLLPAAARALRFNPNVA